MVYVSPTRLMWGNELELRSATVKYRKGLSAGSLDTLFIVYPFLRMLVREAVVLLPMWRNIAPIENWKRISYLRQHTGLIGFPPMLRRSRGRRLRTTAESGPTVSSAL